MKRMINNECEIKNTEDPAGVILRDLLYYI